MTETDQSETAGSETDNNPGAFTKARESDKIPTVNAFGALNQRIKYWIQRRIGKVPCYYLGPNGIRREFYSLDDTDKLPFDPATYSQCQIFVGSIANPVRIDVDEYTKNLENIDEEDIIFSSRYKTYMRQNVLTGIFSGTGLNTERLFMLLYANLAIMIIVLMAVIFA